MTDEEAEAEAEAIDPGPASSKIRHEFTAPNGDEMAIEIGEDGSLRLLLVWPLPREESDEKPRDHAYALLALVAQLLRERQAPREAVAALHAGDACTSMVRASGIDTRRDPLPHDPMAWCDGFNAAKAAALAAIEVSRETS